jgi:dTMP kinase
MSWNKLMNKGLFVTFDGIDGCGKSTQLELAASFLKSRNIDCVVTREPGGTAISEKIRSILLSPENGEMCDKCEVLLYCAARAQHVNDVIAPAVARGSVVLCDRFAEATFAYQGSGRGMSIADLEMLNNFAVDGIIPALTFIFDIDIATARERLDKSGKKADRLEGSGSDFFEKVRKGYLMQAGRFPDRIIVFSGTLSAEKLSSMVCERIIAGISG